MWRTSGGGDRKLEGAERALFVAGVAALWRKLRKDPGFVTGIDMFDFVPEEDRPYVVLKVARALCGDEDPPELSAWSEAAVHAVFRFVIAAVECEFRSRAKAPKTEWRDRVLRAWLATCHSQADEADEACEADEGSHQPVTSRDADEWEFKVEGLADQILWDRDFDLQEVFMDGDPRRAAAVKEHMGIHEDYFMESCPAFTDADRRALMQFLESLEREEALQHGDQR